MARFSMIAAALGVALALSFSTSADAADQHHEYVFTDNGSYYVYSVERGFTLVDTVMIPGITRLRDVTADATDGFFYIRYGDHRVKKWDYIGKREVWDRTDTPGDHTATNTGDSTPETGQTALCLPDVAREGTRCDTAATPPAESPPTPAAGPRRPDAAPAAPRGGNAAALWGSDFEDGDLSIYKTVRKEGSGDGGSHVISTAEARTGRSSMKITVPAPTSTAAPDDVGRYQLVADMPNGTSGQERWYGFSIYFASGWRSSEMADSRAYFLGGEGFRYTGTSDNGPGNNLNAEPRNGGTELVAGSNLSGTVGNDHVGEAWLGPFVTGQWIDFVFHIRWSTRDDGFREAWRDGAVQGRYDGPTLGVDSSFEHRMGVYEGVDVSQTRTLYIDNHRVGTSYEAVDPSR
jgi:hypothetical protein